MADQKRQNTVLHEAVVFFDRNRVVKEMLYMEFAAVLDQVVGIPEFADREIQACYLRINSRLAITGCVFFLIDFDPKGYVNRQWNVPLAHLLENAGRGPDLGAGRIRLSCRSQCSISWHQAQLWDPLLDGEDNSFRLLVRAVRRNRLGIPVEDDFESADAPTLEPHSSARDDQRLRLATLKSEYQEQVEQLHRRYRAQMARAEESIGTARQLLKDERGKSQQLQSRLAQQTQQFQELRQRWQHDLAAARNGDQQRENALQEEFEVELKARVEQATAELKEQLDTREVELFYREEQLGSLREEVTRLRQEREAMMQHSGDRVLRRLAENGVTFVAYQPGVEHMPIPLADIPRYLESPLDYTAEHCFVTPDQYQEWLVHYELPVCTAALGDGGVCGEPVAKVERPNQFMPGESDRCAQHQPLAGNESEQRINHGS